MWNMHIRMKNHEEFAQQKEVNWGQLEKGLG